MHDGDKRVGYYAAGEGGITGGNKAGDQNFTVQWILPWITSCYKMLKVYCKQNNLYQPNGFRPLPSEKGDNSYRPLAAAFKKWE